MAGLGLTLGFTMGSVLSPPAAQAQEAVQLFWRLVGTAIAMTDTTGQAWEHLKEALLDAAADDRITLLEVLQNVEAGLLVIDTQRISTLLSQVRVAQLNH
jgi:hypothetical protein